MSNIIDKIRLSGVTYTLSASTAGGSPTVELTQAEYDALVTAGTVAQDTYYIITDAQAVDLSEYWTSAQTQSAITEAISGKTDVSAFTAHTADTTIHVTSSDKAAWNAKSDFSGSYNDLTDKPTIPTVPTNVSSFNNDAGYATSGYVDSAVSGKTDTSAFTAHTADTTIHVTSSDKAAWDGAATNASAAVTALGGLKLVKLTQSQYDGLVTKDSDTVYFIVG